MPKVTDPQQRALVELRARGGEGVLDRHGKVVAAGERLLGLEPVTWLRLLTTGLVEVRGPLRIGLTAEGEARAVEPTRKINPHGIRGTREPVPAHPGAE